MNKLRIVKKAFGVELRIHDYHVINERFEALKELAPAVSVSHLSFKKENGFITGTIKIRSLNLDFESEYSDTDIVNIYNYLEIDILDQLNEWKKIRFQVSTMKSIVA